MACELPSKRGAPLSRFSTADIRRVLLNEGIVQAISPATVWRCLAADALRPWRHHSWIYPRDPDFARKAGRVLDLYERVWEGEPLGPNDYVISADEKTSIQARARRHPLKFGKGSPGTIGHPASWAMPAALTSVRLNKPS